MFSCFYIGNLKIWLYTFWINKVWLQFLLVSGYASSLYPSLCHVTVKLHEVAQLLLFLWVKCWGCLCSLEGLDNFCCYFSWLSLPLFSWHQKWVQIKLTKQIQQGTTAIGAAWKSSNIMLRETKKVSQNHEWDCQEKLTSLYNDKIIQKCGELCMLWWFLFLKQSHLHT